MLHITDIVPIDDETLWGDADARTVENACYWPFAEMLGAFYKLAKKNWINWPLAAWEWKDLEKVRAAMAQTYQKLPAEDKEFIREGYEWFLEKSKIIDWKAMADYQGPGEIIPNEQFLSAQKDIEEKQETV